jgi:hypothetical protein
MGELSVNPQVSAQLPLANAAFIVRLFIFQQDCGHGAVDDGMAVSAAP